MLCVHIHVYVAVVLCYSSHLVVLSVGARPEDKGSRDA